MDNAWVIASAPDEDDAIDFVWDGDEFIAVGQINNAQTFADTQFTVEEMRATEGDLQQRFTDRDVRLARVIVTVALV